MCVAQTYIIQQVDITGDKTINHVVNRSRQRQLPRQMDNLGFAVSSSRVEFSTVYRTYIQSNGKVLEGHAPTMVGLQSITKFALLIHPFSQPKITSTEDGGEDLPARLPGAYTQAVLVNSVTSAAAALTGWAVSSLVKRHV